MAVCGILRLSLQVAVLGFTHQPNDASASTLDCMCSMCGRGVTPQVYVKWRGAHERAPSHKHGYVTGGPMDPGPTGSNPWAPGPCPMCPWALAPWALYVQVPLVSLHGGAGALSYAYLFGVEPCKLSFRRLYRSAGLAERLREGLACLSRAFSHFRRQVQIISCLAWRRPYGHI